MGGLTRADGPGLAAAAGLGSLRAPGGFSTSEGLPERGGLEILCGLTAPAGLAGFPGGFLGIGSLFALAGLDGFFATSAPLDRLAPAGAFETDPGGALRGTSAAAYSGDGSQSPLKRSRSPLGTQSRGWTPMPNARTSRRRPSATMPPRSGVLTVISRSRARMSSFREPDAPVVDATGQEAGRLVPWMQPTRRPRRERPSTADSITGRRTSKPSCAARHVPTTRDAEK